MEDPQKDEVRRHAEWQLQRELNAREQIARAAGLALIELSAILEEEHAVLDESVDPLGVVLVAFAARGRRLLRSAFRLLDAGEASEAVPLLRTISEFLIVGRWLQQHPDRLDAWALADIRKRKYTIGEVIREFGDADANTTAILEAQRQELEEVEQRWLDQHGEPVGQVVNVEQMAAQTDLGFAYQLSYRTQSEIDVHATPVSADSCYERLPDNKLRLLPAPKHALHAYNQYEIGAHMLLDLLATTSSHMRGFMWTNGLEGITAALLNLRESDPRKQKDAPGWLVERVTEETVGAGDGAGEDKGEAGLSSS